MLFSHSFSLASGTEDCEPLYWWSHGQSNLGTVAVHWFFVYSGFLITQSWERSRSAWSFLKKRVARIYPGYLMAMAVCLWVVMPLVGATGFPLDTPKESAGCAWRILTLRYSPSSPGFARNPNPHTVDGSLWTIRFEFCCYIGVMALGLLTLLRRPRLILSFFALALIAGSILLIVCQSDHAYSRALRSIGALPLLARLVPHYLAGMAAYLYRDRIRYTGRLALLALVGFLVAGKVPFGYTVISPTLGAYLGLYLAFTSDWRWQGAAKHGDFSYGIYLYSWPIQQLIMSALDRRVHPLTLFGLALGPTVLAGILSWYAVERSFLKRDPSPTRPRQPLTAIPWAIGRGAADLARRLRGEMAPRPLR